MRKVFCNVWVVAAAAIGIFVIADLGVSKVDAAERSAKASRPNIVLIMADDMGYECVAANGGTTYKTPHLDRLAKNGMRFEHCYSQPICTPSRVKIMTGIYNQRNYIKFGLLDPQATTFANILKKSGYSTCVAGKWQLLGGLEGPNKFGFDEYCLWQLTRRPSRFPNPGLEVNGELKDYKGKYGPDIVTDYICDFMERKKDGPFLVWYPMILPHWPFEPTPDSKDWDPTAKGVLKGQGKPPYFVDMVNYTDKMVGKLAKKLDDLGIRENTVIIFTGDNGCATSIVSKMGDVTIKGAKGNTTDAGHHVPMIVSWPGTAPKGVVSQDLIDFSDFLPTLVDLAGTKVPSKLKNDGQSFAPQLKGQTGNPREFVHIWYARNGGPKGKQYTRDQRFKLYDAGAFFDISKDANEKRALNTNSLTGEAKAAFEKLEKGLAQYRGTRVMKPGPPKKPKKNNKKKKESAK